MSAPHTPSPDALSAPSVTSFLRRHSPERPAHTALIDGATGESLTYAELLAQVLGQADEFRGAGVRHGDRVGILGVNSLPYTVSLLALAELGAIAVPTPTRRPRSRRPRYPRTSTASSPRPSSTPVEPRVGRRAACSRSAPGSVTRRT